MVKHRGSWRTFDHLEIATAEWVDWFNRRQPQEYCDDLTPVEAEAVHYGHHQTPATVGDSQWRVSGLAGAVQAERKTNREPPPRVDVAGALAYPGHLRGQLRLSCPW